ncbi:MAG TPA: hypothetical protein VME20_12010 [Acidimicrobiales bacterium]|nr:hypothetical protein [Acidimicrobiales bacterium]
MVPTAYHGFFAGCASVAATLIGLLFVAISVSPHKEVGRRAPLSFQVQAAVAFTTLIDTLVVALVALLPGNNPGYSTMVLACAGISSTIGMTVLALRDWPAGRDRWHLVIIPVLGALYILQLLNGIDLSLHPRGPGPIHRQALLVIVFFVIAVQRAWELLGARDTRMAAVVGHLVRERRALAMVPTAVSETTDDATSTLPEQPGHGAKCSYGVPSPSTGGLDGPTTGALSS